MPKSRRQNPARKKHRHLTTLRRFAVRKFSSILEAVLNLEDRLAREPKKIGIFLLLAGALLLIFPNRVLTSSRPPSNLEPIKIDQQLLSLKVSRQPPERIVIPNLNIDLPVVEAKVVNGFWETSETSASHGLGSASPGEIGNMVIFAHARDNLFGPLRNLKKEMTIYVLTKDHWYSYQTKEIKSVAPDDIQVIAPTSDETLTLYTCSGFFDSKRLIVVAKP